MFAIEHSLAIIVFAELEEQLCNCVAFQVGKANSQAMKVAIYGIESNDARNVCEKASQKRIQLTHTRAASRAASGML